MNYMRTILHIQSLRYFNDIAIQNNGSTNNNIKHITEGLFGYFFLINAISKQQCD